jgi:hypothetical protein
MSVDRCFDCLEEIKPTDRRFAVLKTLQPGDKVPSHMVDFNLSQECVCADCAGWYGTEAVELPEAEV